MSPADLMQIAIEQARLGMRAGQSPFGCAIARGGDLLAAAHNTVVRDHDCTAHAEINALRAACRQTGDVHLPRCIVATTCEPCPMCAAALHWARVEAVYFGATIADATAAGFNELQMRAEELLSQGNSPIMVEAGILEAECRDLFAEWLHDDGRVPY